jgi:ferredoxin
MHRGFSGNAAWSWNNVRQTARFRRISGALAPEGFCEYLIEERIMPYVVTESCIKCKHTNCVSVCPVDCFHEGPNFLAIDPAVCIDCGVCEPECPVKAISPHDRLREDQAAYLDLNRELSKIWPVICERKEALPDAEHWATVTEKLAELVR